MLSVQGARCCPGHELRRSTPSPQLARSLFTLAYKRVACALVQEDHTMLAFRLSQIRLGLPHLKGAVLEAELEFLTTRPW